MTRTRSTLVVLALFVLAIPVITGASSAPDAREGVGDASAGLLGAHLEVEDLDGLTSGILGDLVGELGLLEALDTSGLTSLDTRVDLGLIEGLTAATTRDTPDARAALSPLRIGDDRPHDVSAGPGEQRGGDAVVPGPLSALVSGLGLSVFGVSADADEDGAIAQIDALDATLDALSVTSLDIGITGVVSEVTRTGSSATQDLTVDGLAIGLGDILPAELLEALPLDVLLDLIEELGDVGLLSGVDGLRDALESAVADATTSIQAVNAFELGDIDEGLLDDLADAIDLLGDLEDIEDLGGLVSTVENLLDLGTLLGSSEESELLAIISLLEDADELVDVAGDCTGSITEALLEGIEDCVDDVIAQLQSLVDDLLGDIVADTGLGELLALVEGLVDDLLAIDELVDTILGLVDDIAGLDLLTADRLGLEVLASADGEGGSTTIACELGGLEVLGEVIGDTSCTDGSLGGGVTGAVSDAFDVLGGVLESLPGVAEVGELRLDVLPVATEDVWTDDEDGTVTARAHAVLLELVVPSVTIDPSGVDDILALPVLDGLGDLTDLVDDLLSETELDELLPTTELDQLTALLDGLVDEITDVLGDVLGLIDGLDLDVLGISVSTPSISLVLDPVSQATFTPASADDPADDPGDDPTPTPDTPELPRTGGGIALLGLLAMLGALGLRRTG